MAGQQPRKLEHFGRLTPAELRVLEELDTAHATVLGKGPPRPDAGPELQLRASFVRWCVLGAGEGNRLHEKGLRVVGALVVSDGVADSELGGDSTPGLDLEGCRFDHDLVLSKCRFADAPVLRAARLGMLNLNGSVFPGFGADGLAVTNGISLREVEVFGEVRLLGARIVGDLTCSGAKFRNTDGDVFSGDRVEISGSAFFRGVRVIGSVRFTGASVNGDLSCNGADFGGPDRNLSVSNFTLQGIKVSGGFYWRQRAKISGVLDLSAAEFGDIIDEPVCWPEAGKLILNRCTYGAFSGQGISGEARLRWLGLQDPAQYGQDFWPQPWEQCANVLRKMGHAEDARAILIDKERRLRADRRRRATNQWRRRLLATTDKLLDQTVRFGHRPLRAVTWLMGLWVIGVATFLIAWQADAMKPNNAFVLRAPEWVGCAETAPPWTYRGSGRTSSQLDCFLGQPEAQGFPEFNALIYSADVLLPVVEIEQQANWTPDEDLYIGAVAKGLMYFNILAGWALSLLAVAGFSGLVKSD